MLFAIFMIETKKTRLGRTGGFAFSTFGSALSVQRKKYINGMEKIFDLGHLV